MSIVKLLSDEQYSQQIQNLDRRVREYTQAPGMTNYVKAAAYKPAFLENMAAEHLYVMPTKRLRRKTKEIIATAVSMANACDYCITAHTGILRRMFKVSDEEIVEIAAATAHASGLNAFERATMPAGVPAFPLIEPEQEPLLGEIERALGALPSYYRIMAGNRGYLEIVWAREQATMLSGTVDVREKVFIGLAASVANGAPHGIQVFRERLRRLGISDEELFEALMVVEIFHKNNVFTNALQLRPGLWTAEPVPAGPAGAMET